MIDRKIISWSLLGVSLLLVAYAISVYFRIFPKNRCGVGENNRINLHIAALDLYRLDNGEYPTTAQGLSALHHLPNIAPIPKNWNGPYTKRPIVDCWGTEYQYEHQDGYIDVISLGADRSKGGSGFDADISYQAM